MTRETAELTFRTTGEGKRIVRLAEPALVVLPPLLQEAANRIIAANPFDETVGNLEGLIRAERVAVNRTVLI